MRIPCYQCFGHSPIAGVIWPIRSDDDGHHDWVERCDECCVFIDDYAAAEALAEYLGLKQFTTARLHRGKGKFQSYIGR